MRHSLLALLALLASAGAAHAQDADTCGIADFAPGLKQDGDALAAQWNSEAQALLPLGADASFDLTAPELHATFAAPATLTAAAPITVVAAAGCSIAGADVDGVGHGRVDLAGASFTAAGAVDGNAYAVDAADGAVSLRVDLASITLGAGAVSGYESATLVDDASGASTPLGASFTLGAAGAVTCGADTQARVSSPGPVSLTAADFALAGDFAADAAATFDGAAVTPVRSIVGTSAALTITPGEVAGTARATQIFDDDGPRARAEIEVVALSPVVAVPAGGGGSANVPMLVRNKSGKAVAILKEIDVDGCATEAVTPVVDEALPDVVDTLVAVIQDSGWAAPFVAVAVAPILGVAVVAEAFADIAGAFVDVVGDILCGIFGCDDGGDAPPAPVPPVPFPKWLEPGQVAFFEVALLPQVGDGDYPVRVRFVGESYDEVHADFTMRVGRGAAPSAWQCDVAAYGGGDGCDCGCGAADSECADADAVCATDHCTPFGGTLGADNASCSFAAPPSAGGGDDVDDGGDGASRRGFDCSNVPAVEASVWGSAVLLALFVRRRRRRRPSARGR